MSERMNKERAREILKDLNKHEVIMFENTNNEGESDYTNIDVKQALDIAIDSLHHFNYQELFKQQKKVTEMCLKLITEMQKFYIEDCFEVEQGNFTYEQLFTRYIMKDASISKKIKQLYRDLEKLGLKVEPYERKE